MRCSCTEHLSRLLRYLNLEIRSINRFLLIFGNHRPTGRTFNMHFLSAFARRSCVYSDSTGIRLCRFVCCKPAVLSRSELCVVRPLPGVPRPFAGRKFDAKHAFSRFSRVNLNSACRANRAAERFAERVCRPFRLRPQFQGCGWRAVTRTFSRLNRFSFVQA